MKKLLLWIGVCVALLSGAVLAQDVTGTWQGTISAQTQSMNLDYSAFEGWPVVGRPSLVTVRGHVAVRDGTFVGTSGRGQFLSRTPSH